MCVRPCCEDDILLRGASSAPMFPLASNMTHMQGPLPGEGHGRMSAEPLRLHISQCVCSSVCASAKPHSPLMVPFLLVSCVLCHGESVHARTRGSSCIAAHVQHPGFIRGDAAHSSSMSAWLILSKGLESLILSETPESPLRF